MSPSCKSVKMLHHKAERGQVANRIKVAHQLTLRRGCLCEPGVITGTLDHGQGVRVRSGVMGEAGCEDGTGPQGKEGEQPLGWRKRRGHAPFKPAGNHNFILAKQ